MGLINATTCFKGLFVLSEEGWILIFLSLFPSWHTLSFPPPQWPEERKKRGRKTVRTQPTVLLHWEQSIGMPYYIMRKVLVSCLTFGDGEQLSQRDNTAETKPGRKETTSQ